MGSDVKILSMNVKGLYSNKKKRVDVFNWLKNKNASIICLQETHSIKEIENIWEDEFGGKIYFSHFSSNSAGVCIMFKPNFDYKVHNEIVDKNGRYVILDLTVKEQRLVLVNLYGYNTDKPEIFNDILQNIVLLKASSILMCGDWNFVQEKSIDTFNVNYDRHKKCRDKVDEIIENCSLVDPWRLCNPNEKKFTWRQRTPLRQSRIDFFLVSEDLLSLMIKSNIIPGYRTDHSAIDFSFKASLSKRGRGYWKFNSQLLRDLDYIRSVKSCINDTVSEYYLSGDEENYHDVNLSCDDQTFLELLKVKIRSFTITYCIQKSRETQEITKNLEKNIQELENLVNTQPSDQNHTILLEKKCELERHRERLVDGLLLRSKANWHENGEKCTKFFCQLEKKNFINKTLSEIITDDGKHISNQQEILKCQEDYYKKLYTSQKEKYTNISDETFFHHDVNLSDEVKDSLEGELTFSECSEALKPMGNNKSPGSDGFTAEFYKFFWKNIGPFVLRSLNYGYEHGKFSQFQTQGVITCIPKENKDRRYLNNWRPISLLNVDLKIGSAAIANRIKKVLPTIISESQKGFLKDRFIGDNIRLLYDLMHYLEENNLEGLLLLIDFEKAFDSVEWDFILKSLQSFNFGPSICRWFSTFYRDSKSCVINNGNMSNFFCLERGCRQGDPLSPYLFIIGVELLALKIKSNPDINGIFVGESESLISQYADDTFLTLDGSEKSLQESLTCFEKFYHISGLKMNATKTRAVWIGSKRYSDSVLCKNFNLLWSNCNFKLLGIRFSLELQEMIHINYNEKIKELMNVLKSWQHRKLTLLGKITVIKTLALPKLVHLFSSLPNLSQEMISKVNKIFYSFIWDGKPERLKRNVLIGDYLDGGLKMIHIQSFNDYLKLGWVKRYLVDTNSTWQKIIGSDFKKYGGDRVFNLKKEKVQFVAKEVKNLFWRDVLSDVSEARPHCSEEMQEILSTDILNFVNDSDFDFFNRWKVYGIQHMCDILNVETHNFLSFEEIKQKCNTNNFIKYYSLLSNIPASFKRFISSNAVSFNFEAFAPSDNFIERILCNKKLKFVYNLLVQKIAEKPESKIYAWEQSIGESLDEWHCIFDIPKRCCRNTYLKCFQYKLLHRIIPTNTFLYKIHISDTRKCTFCTIYDETIEHLLYECVFVQTFWENFCHYLSPVFTNVCIDKKTVFLGSMEDTNLLNLLFIIAKQYIYKCKLNNVLPTLEGLKCKVKNYMLLDFYSAEKDNLKFKAERFWAPLRNFF